MNKYKDAEASANTEFTEDVPEDHEGTVAGDIDEGNKKNTPDYVRKMDLDIAIIDKNGKNAWRKIYEEIDAPYSGEVKIRTK